MKFTMEYELQMRPLFPQLKYQTGILQIDSCRIKPLIMDEAASKLSIEITSVPAELDALNRKMTQLKIEQEALKKVKSLRTQKSA